MKIKKDQIVKVVAGDDKGKTGKVLAVKGEKVIVEGVNILTKHVKPQNGQPGQIVKAEGPIHISNVASTTIAQ